VTLTESPELAPPSRRARWIVAISLVIAGIGGLTVWAIGSPDALAYYKTPSEISSTDGAQRLRVGGRMVDGTLERDGTLTTFAITDGKQRLNISYRGEVPDTLKDGSDVIAEGRMSSDGLAADKVLAKCSSKFVPKDKPEHLGA
jgi:cytochrome c-type biogenesis protein CcmE